MISNNENLTDYREFLRAELDQRRNYKMSYSLRKFATDLTVSPSLLSEVLNGKHGFSVKKAEIVAEKLNLSLSDQKIFCELVRSENSRSKKAKEQSQRRVLELRQQKPEVLFDEDMFHLISDWYHLAILSLMESKDWIDDTSWIAKRLSISKLQAENAIRRLKRIGMIQKIDGRLTSSTQQTATSRDIPSDAIRKFHSQVLRKAEKSLFFQNVEQREIATSILAIKKSQVDAAKRELKAFHDHFCQKYETVNSDADEVYALHASFFKLSTP